MSTIREIPPFHLAFPGARPRRRAPLLRPACWAARRAASSAEWIDFDLFGHQIVAHLAPGQAADHHNPVDGHDVPVPHFGVVLDWDDFHALAERLRAAGVKFVIEPYIRFAGQVGEQATMFFRDPSGNALEFKSFRDRSQLFAK
jgi:extradiol dioxygenase family protein